MGCFVSTLNDSGERRCPKNVGELAVFVPGLRIPKPVDFAQPARGDLSESLVERLSALRTRIVVMANQGTPMTIRPRRAATRHGGSTLADLLQALEDYLPVLLGLVESGNQLQHDWQFSWINQEDGVEATTMSNSWYEVLSVLHLMAMLSLSQANLLLLSNRSTDDDYHSKLSEEMSSNTSVVKENPSHLKFALSILNFRRASIDIFLKAAGYLDFAVEHVLPQFPSELRNDLPLDLAEGTLRALCLQALGQVVDIQLGMAIDSFEATLAVKRRLACEMVKYWQQAQENIMDLPLASGWGEKHKLFIQWKYVEAKAAAYYLHGLINSEGNAKNSNEMAVTALHAAEEFLIVSKKACEAFHLASPVSRNSPMLGANKYLSDKIPKDVSSRVASTQLLQNHERIVQAAPTLPDFALSLKPDEYQLPLVDPSWNDFFKDKVPYQGVKCELYQEAERPTSVRQQLDPVYV